VSYKLNVAQPIIEPNGTMSQAFRQFTQEATLSIPIVGVGSPEGVIEAVQYSLYLDSTGALLELSSTGRCFLVLAVTESRAGFLLDYQNG